MHLIFRLQMWVLCRACIFFVIARWRNWWSTWIEKRYPFDFAAFCFSPINVMIFCVRVTTSAVGVHRLKKIIFRKLFASTASIAVQGYLDSYRQSDSSLVFQRAVLRRFSMPLQLNEHFQCKITRGSCTLIHRQD